MKYEPKIAKKKKEIIEDVRHKLFDWNGRHFSFYVSTFILHTK